MVVQTSATTTPCLSCGYDLAGLAVSNGKSTCPECGTAQDAEQPCRRCGASLVGATVVDGCATCPACGAATAMRAMTARDAAFSRRRRWLVWSPAWVMPLGFVAQLLNDRELLPGVVALFWLSFAWCYVAPFAYGIIGSWVRLTRGQRAWPAIEVGCLWLVTSVLTTIVMFLVAGAAAALGVLS